VMKTARTGAHRIIIRQVPRPRRPHSDDAALDAAEMASTPMDPAAQPVGAARRGDAIMTAGSSGRDALAFVRADWSSSAWLARVNGNATTKGQ
jgi:hypothetical protein